MKKVLLFFVFTSIMVVNSFAQKVKTNPIVFAEILGGYSNGSSKGFTEGGTLNFQKNQYLFTYRYLEVTEKRKEGGILFVPVYDEVAIVKEQALMLGKRIIEDNLSYSFSAGISYIDREFLVDDSNGVLKYDNVQSIGFPFELNIKWFNSSKKKYRIYELIPIGKPTSLSNSIGFKFYGDISKTSFVGLGLTFGLGWHKNY